MLRGLPGYSKVFYLESARALEPLADDLASLGLDVLVGEEGFSRVSNPFVLGVMARARRKHLIPMAGVADTHVTSRPDIRSARRTGGVPGVARVGK